MKLNMDNGAGIDCDRILGIFDIDSATISGTTRDFLTRAERGGRLQFEGGGIPLSFVLFREGGGGALRLSRFTTACLRARVERGVEVQDSDSLLKRPESKEE